MQIQAHDSRRNAAKPHASPCGSHRDAGPGYARSNGLHRSRLQGRIENFSSKAGVSTRRERWRFCRRRIPSTPSRAKAVRVAITVGRDNPVCCAGPASARLFPLGPAIPVHASEKDGGKEECSSTAITSSRTSPSTPRRTSCSCCSGSSSVCGSDRCGNSGYHPSRSSPETSACRRSACGWS